MIFMWRSSAIAPADFTSITPSVEFYFRIFICAVLGVGVVYGVLISITFRRYGEKMDQAWKKRVDGFVVRAVTLPQYLQPRPVPVPHADLGKSNRASRRTRGPPPVHVRPGWHPVNPPPRPDYTRPTPRQPPQHVRSPIGSSLVDIMVEPPSGSEPGSTIPNSSLSQILSQILPPPGA